MKNRTLDPKPAKSREAWSCKVQPFSRLRVHMRFLFTRGTYIMQSCMRMHANRQPASQPARQAGRQEACMLAYEYARERYACKYA